MQRLRIVVVTAILALITCASSTCAQPIRIPNSEMPGRERERFVDPPSPKSQPGRWLTPAPSTTAHPVSKRRRGHAAKPTK
jgi:hypothetical protein